MIGSTEIKLNSQKAAEVMQLSMIIEAAIPPREAAERSSAMTTPPATKVISAAPIFHF